MTLNLRTSLLIDPKTASRPGTVLQVVPALMTGGVERGTLDVAAALHQAGYGSLVASSGGAPPAGAGTEMRISLRRTLSGWVYSCLCSSK